MGDFSDVSTIEFLIVLGLLFVAGLIYFLYLYFKGDD